MAQTISDLEKEREKILAAIDEHAKQFSSKRGKDNEASAHSLSDWLNAAEEVVTLSDDAKGTSIAVDKPKNIKHKPINKNPNPESKNMSAKPTTQTRSKASFVGVILMLCLLLTVIGVIYLAYVSFEKEVKLIKQESLEKFEALETQLAKLEKDLAVGGDSSVFDALTTRIDGVENSLAGLQHLDTHSANTQDITNQLESLEKRMNLRITGLLKGTTSLKDEQGGAAHQADLAVVQQPLAPVEPRAPRVEPKAVKPVVQDNPDVSWLKSQKPNDLILQLASVPAERVRDLENQIASKNIQGARLVPQKVSASQTNFVLIVGSFANRVDANQASLELKRTTGMEAWIRPAKDLINRLN